MKPPDVPFFLRKRYYLMSLLFIGNMLITLLKEAEFNLTNPQKGVILSSYSWGYMASPLGALISNKVGGLRVFGQSSFIAAILTILSPVFIQWDIYALILVRALEGFFHGLAGSSKHAVFAKWVPPDERARLINFTLLGASAGAAISYPLTGFISYHSNWKNVFYITGGITIIWYLILFSTTENSPLEDKIITKAEKEYFKGVCEEVAKKKVTIPWKSIFTSPAVFAYWNDRFVESWSTSFLMTCLPLYIKDLHPSNVKDIGILSGIPHMFEVFSTIVCAWILDHLRSRGINKTSLHKSVIMLGQIPAACLLIIIGFWTNFHCTIIGFSIFKICYCWATVSYHILPSEMSLQHASFLVGVAFTIRAIGHIINPIVMGFMVKNHLHKEWSQYFWFLSLFNLWGAVIFSIYGSGEVQPWANSNN